MDVGSNLFQIMRLTQTAGVKPNAGPQHVPEKDHESQISSPKSFFGSEAASADFSQEALNKSNSENSHSKEQELSKPEKEEVKDRKERDTEVRQHEQAHLAAAGQYAKGGAQYEFQTGPDNQQYAVGGEVNIDTSPIQGDPSATIAKAQVLQSAATAPAEPSAQDNKVAAEAAKMEAKAQKELREETQEAPGELEEASSNTIDNNASTSEEQNPNSNQNAQRNAQRNAAHSYSQNFQAFSPGHTNFSRQTFGLSA